MAKDAPSMIAQAALEQSAAPTALDADETYRAALRLRLGGDNLGARALLEAILTARPDHIEAINTLGVLAWELGDRAAAIDCFMRAVSLDSENPARLRNL